MKGNIYVIQKHHATRLHYDLRLELDGVLKSWAIPKTIPMEKDVKRLAIQTENHSLEYADFEEVIPEGNYGAGSVEIWDKGRFEIEEREEDKLVIHLYGNKLEGRYCLIRFKGQEKNWLFFKC
ncbi:MAG: 3'-phosphoesterase [Thermoplasmatales archaeon]|nr:MAG: 3'-phosphoesterase [Thermoplasmatales archaeon]